MRRQGHGEIEFVDSTYGSWGPPESQWREVVVLSQAQVR